MVPSIWSVGTQTCTCMDRTCWHSLSAKSFSLLLSKSSVTVPPVPSQNGTAAALWTVARYLVSGIDQTGFSQIVTTDSCAHTLVTAHIQVHLSPSLA